MDAKNNVHKILFKGGVFRGIATLIMEINTSLLEQHKRVASWMGSPKRVITQLLVSTWSFLTLPWMKPQSDATRRYFEELYGGRNDPLLFDGKNEGYLDQIELVLDLKTVEHKMILDIGCGNGALYYWLKNRGVEVWNYMGVDIAHPATQLSANAHIIKEDIKRFTANEENVKSIAIFMVNTLCYLDDEEFRRVIGSRNKLDEIIIVDPVPGLFWDAHFQGIVPHYRSPKKVSEILCSTGWEIASLSVDYAGIGGLYIAPLSYAIHAVH